MITVNQLSFNKGKQSLLDKITTAFPVGQFSLILGPNGAGKSTLLKAIAGRISPSSGMIYYHGLDISKLAPNVLACHRAVVTQYEDRQPLQGITLLEYLAIGIKNTIQSPTWQTSLQQVLHDCNIRLRLDLSVETLSGGEFQKLRIARALLQLLHQNSLHSRYLLLDEPTAALDPDQSDAIFSLCKTLCTTLKIGIICITHDLQAAQLYADHVLLIKEGRSLTSGPTQQVLTPSYLNQLYGIPFQAFFNEKGQRVWLPFSI